MANFRTLEPGHRFEIYNSMSRKTLDTLKDNAAELYGFSATATTFEKYFHRLNFKSGVMFTLRFYRFGGCYGLRDEHP